MVQYCLCSDGIYLRKQRCEEEGAKRTVVVMLQVSMCVNEIKNFERTQLAECLLLSKLLTEQLHL